MLHTVELSEKTFRRLQAIARPLIDDTNSVIDRLIEHFERTHNSTPVSPGSSKAIARKFDPTNVPPLTHTKVIRVSFGAEEIERPNWNELMRKAIEIAFAKLGDFDEVRRVSAANIVKGHKTDEGFSALASLSCSIQGVDAHDAWRIAFAVAKRLSLALEVTFEWRDKEAAAHPGEVGMIVWRPAAIGSQRLVASNG